MIISPQVKTYLSNIGINYHLFKYGLPIHHRIEFFIPAEDTVLTIKLRRFNSRSISIQLWHDEERIIHNYLSYDTHL